MESAGYGHSLFPAEKAVWTDAFWLLSVCPEMHLDHVLFFVKAMYLMILSFSKDTECFSQEIGPNLSVSFFEQSSYA